MKYEIINHGWDNAQYFQGCGVTFTDFNYCVTGCGDDAKEAYEDAVEQVAQVLTSKKFTKLALPKRPRGINAKDKVPARLSRQEENECYWYVSIRF